MLCELAVVDLEPDQFPLAVHEVAFAGVQFNVTESPLFTVTDLAPLANKLTEGGLPGGLTFTVTLSDDDPPAFEHVMVYVWDELKLPVLSEPFVALLPDQPFDALQLSALVDVHDNVAESPLDIVIGPSEPLALISTETACGVGVGVLLAV